MTHIQTLSVEMRGREADYSGQRSVNEIDGGRQSIAIVLKWPSICISIKSIKVKNQLMRTTEVDRA